MDLNGFDECEISLSICNIPEIVQLIWFALGTNQ